VAKWDHCVASCKAQCEEFREAIEAPEQEATDSLDEENIKFGEDERTETLPPPVVSEIFPDDPEVGFTVGQSDTRK